MISPTGRQVDLVHGDQHVVVVEVGGGIRSFRVGEQDVLMGYGPDEAPVGGMGQVLAPWPNRIEDGRYTFDGIEEQLDLTEPDRHNAIHGLVRRLPWAVEVDGPERARLTLAPHPAPGYPFAIDLGVEYELGPDGLRVTVSARNTGERAAPLGLGAHPYVTLGDRVDGLVLTAPAREVRTTDERGIPVGRHPVDGTPYDFRDGRVIGDLVLDHAFAALDRGVDGTAVVSVADVATGRAVEVWLDGGHDHLMLFTGDTLPDGLRRRGIAVEPMTCPPNAFRTGEDVVRLEPGDAFTAAWGIRPRRS